MCSVYIVQHFIQFILFRQECQLNLYLRTQQQCVYNAADYWTSCLDLFLLVLVDFNSAVKSAREVEEDNDVYDT